MAEYRTPSSIRYLCVSSRPPGIGAATQLSGGGPIRVSGKTRMPGRRERSLRDRLPPELAASPHPLATTHCAPNRTRAAANMRTASHWTTWAACLLAMYCGHVQNVVSQRLPRPPPKPQSRTSNLPLHLSLLPPQQSGYIILPKAHFVLPKNGKPPSPKHRPPNHPQQNKKAAARPHLNFPFHEATLPQNMKLDQAGPNRPPVLPNFQPPPPILPKLRPNEFLLTNPPPRKNGKNRPQPQEHPQLPNPIEHGEAPELSHLPPQDNELSNAPPHSSRPADEVPAAESEKQSSFHIPFPDFAEPEPGPQLQPSGFNPSHLNLNLNNKVVSAQESRQTQTITKAKSPASDTPFDQLREETAPIALYGQVLPPNEVSESGHYPDSDDDDAWPLSMPEMPKIVHLDVKCEKNLMRVSMDFDAPFHGIVYSKGHYSSGRCVHLPAGSGRNSVRFDVSVNSCGTQGTSGPTETGSYFENTVVVQWDPLVQEAWDQARRLRCNWHDQYEKTVTFRPFAVDMLQVVRADFAGDNVGCWMQIQVGKGPWASEVSGLVRIGQTMTLVLAIQDEEGRFDMMVRNCIAHDGSRAPVELVDSAGCVVRPKLMSRFTKVRNFGSSASVLSFAHFQAFKFPDSTEVHVQCTVQICRRQCEDQCSLQHRRRRRRETDFREVGLNGVLQVVAAEDLTFSPFQNETEKIVTEKKPGVHVCFGVRCVADPAAVDRHHFLPDRRLPLSQAEEPLEAPPAHPLRPGGLQEAPADRRRQAAQESLTTSFLQLNLKNRKSALYLLAPDKFKKTHPPLLVPSTPHRL